MDELSAFGKAREKGILAFFKTVGKRFLLHVAAMVVSAVMAGTVGEFYCGYVGLVCLLPRYFNLKDNFYLFPFASSVLQLGLFWLGLHDTFNIAIFWAGAQTWLQRTLIRRFEIGMDWSALPFLVIGASAFGASSSAHLQYFCIFTILGLAPFCILTAVQRKTRLNKRIRAILLALEPGLKLQKYPDSFRQQFERLYSLGSHFYGLSVAEKSRHYVMLEPRLRELAPLVDQASRWSKEGFQTQEGNTLLALAAETNNILNDVLARNDTTLLKSDTGKSSALPDKDYGQFTAYYNLAEALLPKRSELPDELGNNLTSLYLSTENIIKCMLGNPSDVNSGRKFLERYLPAAHTVVDEYIRLKHNDGDSTRVAEALEKSAKLLERLSMAFHEEHGNLLRNDAIRFTAEINVVDTLLKMEGK